jgi:hypothetical protein
MLHCDDLTRVKQHYCPTDERVLDRSEIVKGYQAAVQKKKPASGRKKLEKRLHNSFSGTIYG